MLNIIICSNDDIFRNKLENKIQVYLTNNKISYTLKIYKNVQKLMRAYLFCNTIVILDTNFSDISSISIAHKLRVKSNDFILIFISNNLKEVIQAFQVNAFRYILKQQLENQLLESLRAIIKIFKIDNRVIDIKFVGYQSVKVHINQVIYIESYSHKLYFHFNNQCQSKYIYSSLSKIEMMLSSYQFIRIHQSYIINSYYLSEVTKDEVKLIDGNTLPLSKKYFSKVYQLWINMTA